MHKLKEAFSEESFIQIIQQKMQGKKAPDNPELWDLGTLTFIFHNLQDELF